MADAAPERRGRARGVDVPGAVVVLRECARVWSIRSPNSTPLAAVRLPPPVVGQDNQDVLCGVLGLTALEVAELQAQGAV